MTQKKKSKYINQQFFICSDIVEKYPLHRLDPKDSSTHNFLFSLSLFPFVFAISLYQMVPCSSLMNFPKNYVLFSNKISVVICQATEFYYTVNSLSNT